MELTNKTILITGASSGIGKAIAEILARKNRLILLSRKKEVLLSLKQKIEENGNEIAVFPCDVSDFQDVSLTFKNIKAKYQNIDLAILNAGVSFRTAEGEIEIEKAEKTFKVNIFGLIYCVSELLNNQLLKKNSIIAGVSSMADRRGFPKSGFYCASKAAASIYLESLRNELFFKGIKVITIKPGFVKTPMTDKNEFKMPLIIEADKAAEIIIRGIKNEKRIIRFPSILSLLTRIMGIIPSFIFDNFSRIHIKSINASSKILQEKK